MSLQISLWPITTPVTVSCFAGHTFRINSKWDSWLPTLLWIFFTLYTQFANVAAGRRLEILDLYIIKVVKANRCLWESRLRKRWCTYDLVCLFCCRNERFFKSYSLMIRIFCDIKPYHSAIFMTCRKNNIVLSKCRELFTQWYSFISGKM